MNSTAEFFMDALFRHHNSGYFEIEEAIKRSSLNQEQKQEALKIQKDIAELITKDYRYGLRIGKWPIVIEVNDTGMNAIQKGGHFAYQKYIEERDNPQLTSINSIGINYGVVAQSGRDSSLTDFENKSAPNTIPTNTAITSKKKTFLSKALSWIVNNVGKILIGVIITLIGGYLLYRFGWKK